MEYELFNIPSNGIRLKDAFISPTSMNGDVLTLSITGEGQRRYVDLLIAAAYGKINVMQTVQPLVDLVEITIKDTLRERSSWSIASRLLTNLEGTLHVYASAFDSDDIETVFNHLAKEAPEFVIRVDRITVGVDRADDLIELSKRNYGSIVETLVALGSPAPSPVYEQADTPSIL